MILCSAHYTSIGNRDNNEDSLIVINSNEIIFAIIADGLGGESGGEVASQLAVKSISSYLTNTTDRLSEEAILNTFKIANEEIIKSKEGTKGMKSTAALLWLGKRFGIAAHIGDTRIYQFRDNKIIFQSIDHSVSQMSVMLGEIRQCDVRGHVDRNKLTRCLGSSESAEAELTKLTVQEKDAFLICSDGFWEYVTEDEMCYDLRMATNVDEWLTKMRSRVDARNSPTGDNHSAVAVMAMKG